MDRKTKRTIIDLPEVQPELDFDEAAHWLPFTFPEYQRGILTARLAADLFDFGIAAGIYLVFLVATLLQMPEGIHVDRRVLGVYAAGYFALAGVYFLLFMLSSSQTPGMKLRNLVAVDREGKALEPRMACLRGFGYFISIIPLMLGFVWAIVDPEHLTWT